MSKLLPTINSPHDLRGLTVKELEQLAEEIRQAIWELACKRTAHFASNLGVVELTLALHTSFDFSRDRLVWDTGHQVYAHKIITGRYKEFLTTRAKGGLMGYPNPAESPYDLFITGHSGCSVSTALGLRCGDDLLHPDQKRHVVAVVGDGAFLSGIVFEAMNNAGGLKRPLTVVLNDNKMSICPRVGGLAEYLDRLRMNRLYTSLKNEVQRLLTYVPVLGDPVERFLLQVKDAVKAGLVGGMFFEDIGFRYIGPVDGHNIAQLQKYFAMVRDFSEPVLVHVVTEKGHGYKPAAEDPIAYHAPAPLECENGDDGHPHGVAALSSSKVAARRISPKSYTQVVRDTLLEQMRVDKRIVVVTAAMCQGNMLEPIRDKFPERFFDVGICESHAVAFAAGLARCGLHPAVAIYSTFLQRSYDQIFQEVSLQDLPITLLLDRAGLVGPDGPTHHGVFDLAYLRPFPNLLVLAPGDEADAAAMIRFALEHDGPAAIRYPKTAARTLPRQSVQFQPGKAEVLREGLDGALIACGTLVGDCLEAAERLQAEAIDLTVINARSVKPLDVQTIVAAIRRSPFVLTVEEGILAGGFGSAVLEAACDAGVDCSRVCRLGIPDRYIEHGTREELLADLGLDAEGIAASCRRMLQGRLAGAARTAEA